MKNIIAIFKKQGRDTLRNMLGIGSYVWIACMAGSLVICMAGNYSLKTGLIFMGIMAVGILLSAVFFLPFSLSNNPILVPPHSHIILQKRKKATFKV